MGPDERAVRRQALAREVRQAVIELTDGDPTRLTSIPEVTRRLGVTDSNLLCEALEIARGLGWMTAAGGMIRPSGSARAPLDQARRRAPAPLRFRGAKRTHGRRSTRRRAGKAYA